MPSTNTFPNGSQDRREPVKGDVGLGRGVAEIGIVINEILGIDRAYTERISTGDGIGTDRVGR